MQNGKMSKEEFQKACAVAVSNLQFTCPIQNQLDYLTDMFYGYLEARRTEISEEVMVEFHELRQFLIEIRDLERNSHFVTH